VDRGCAKRGGGALNQKGFSYSIFSFSSSSSSSFFTAAAARVFGHSPFWPAKLLLSLPILKHLPANQ
jgi:hypothetical protein